MTAPASSPGTPDTVAWLLQRASLSDDALPLAAGEGDAASLAQLLVKGELLMDLTRLLAAALPPREGVWWAWVSARHAARPDGAAAASPAVAQALGAVERWVSQPDEEARRAAWAAGEKAGMDTPAGCAAAAAFFTSGSVAPAGGPVIPPPPGVHIALVGAAVSLAAVAEPEHFNALASAYVNQGLEVVRQLGGWERSVEMARVHDDNLRESQARMAAAASPPAA